MSSQKTLPIGKLNKVASVAHMVTVVPIWKNKQPDLMQMERVADDVTSFWAQEVPRMRISFRFLPAIRADLRCNHTWAFAAAARAAGVQNSGRAMKLGQHLLAWIPECPETGLVGRGDLSDGRGRFYVQGMSAQTVAHEFGHNLGLDHSGIMSCAKWSAVTSNPVRSALVRFGELKSAFPSSRPLASTSTAQGNCSVDQYEPAVELMGSGSGDDGTARGFRVLGAMGQLLMGGKVLRASSAGEFSVGTVASGLPVVGVISSKLGPILIDMVPALSASVPDEATPAGVRLHLFTSDCDGSYCSYKSAAVIVPGIMGKSTSQDGLSYPDASLLQAGEGWALPGTGFMLQVRSVLSDRAIFTLTNAPANAIALGQPKVIEPISAWGSGLPTHVTWRPAAGAVAYMVVVAGGRVASTTGDTQATFEMPPDFAGSDVKLSVIAISALGDERSSPAVRLDVHAPEVRVTASAREHDPSQGAKQDSLTLPLTLSWTLDQPTLLQYVGSWTLSLNSTQPIDTTSPIVPGSQRTLTIDRSMLDDEGCFSLFVTPNPIGSTGFDGKHLEVTKIGSWRNCLALSDS